MKHFIYALLNKKSKQLNNLQEIIKQPINANLKAAY